MKNKKNRKAETKECFEEHEQSCCRQVGVCDCCGCCDYVYCC